MAGQLFAVDGHGVSYWLGEAVPDKNDTSGHEVSAFSDSTDDLVTVSGVMPAEYAGGDVTVTLHWASWTTTAGTAVWQVEFERLAEDGNATTTTTFLNPVNTFDAPGNPLGSLRYTTFNRTNAQISSIAAGESFRIRVSRLAATNPGGNDTMAGDALLHKIVMDED